MQKDVIYIDVDDDITAIIDKVKSSTHKIIALVPPKRVGVLQSAVNLRLINRAATQRDKRLVLITGNSALAGLAAAATIPVAKNLQSKPELAEIPALSIDEGEDVIDGSELPIGEHARMAAGTDTEAAQELAGAGLAAANEARRATPPAQGVAAKPKVKRGVTVPSFDTFRKKMVLVVLGAFLLIGFLVWAIVFAPKATIAVSTRTTDAAVSQQVTLNPNVDTSPSGSVIKATTKTQNDEVTVKFAATGEKNVGKKATGSVTITHQSLAARTVAAGTQLRASDGAVFVLNEAVTVPASEFGPPDCFPMACPGRAEGSVTALEAGERYNGISGSLSGAGSGFSTSLDGPTSGGTDKIVAVVKQSDIDQAKRKVNDEIDREKAVNELKSQLGDEYIILEDSLQVDTSKLKSSVAVDAEATNREAEYGGAVTFTLYAVATAELDEYLKAVIEQQIDDTETQRVYSSGAKEVQFTNVDSADNGIRATLSTNGKVGPKIDEGTVKELAAGKRIGDIQTAIEAINGVDSVDVTLAPFWVNKAPEKVEKIRVEFTLDD